VPYIQVSVLRVKFSYKLEKFHVWRFVKCFFVPADYNAGCLAYIHRWLFCPSVARWPIGHLLGQGACYCSFDVCLIKSNWGPEVILIFDFHTFEILVITAKFLEMEFCWQMPNRCKIFLPHLTQPTNNLSTVYTIAM